MFYTELYGSRRAAQPLFSRLHPGCLAGRGVELDIIANRLARMRALRRSGGPLLAFHGSRGLGKTSLLREAQRRAVAGGYLTVWATGRDDVPLAPDLARWLGEEVRRSSFGGRARALLQHLESVQVEVGLPGAKVGVTGSSGRGAGDGGTIERSLEDAGLLARDNDHHGLAVFVDEFQETRLPDRRSLLIALQHFDGASPGCPVAIIAAGLPSLLSAVPDAATFGERTEFVEVGLLAEVAVAEALILPAEKAGVRWSSEALELAIGIARGYPHQVQLIGEATWRAARPSPMDVLSVGHVRQGAEQAEQRMATLFRSRLSKVSPDHRRLLSSMAALGAGRGDTPVLRGDIARSLGQSTESLSRPREELIDRGLIESAGRGLLRFTVPGFSAWLRAQDAAELGCHPTRREASAIQDPRHPAGEPTVEDGDGAEPTST